MSLTRWLFCSIVSVLLFDLCLMSGSVAQQAQPALPAVSPGGPTTPAGPPRGTGLPGTTAPPALGASGQGEPRFPGTPGQTSPTAPGLTGQVPPTVIAPAAPAQPTGAAAPGAATPPAPTATPPDTLGAAPGQPPGAGPDLAPPSEPQPLRAEEMSPIERQLAGSIPDPHVLLRQFGYDLFARVPSTFAPVTDVPVGPDYVIGPGDHLNILLWGGVQEAYQTEVDRNGAIALPRLGVVQVWGLTLDQVQRLLQQRFSEFYSDFRMAVTLGRLRTNLIYVVGEVRAPGAYTVSSLSTIINALFASGGPTRNGSLRRIQLMRQGRLVHTLDLYRFLLQGDKSQDLTVQSGDTILVPLIGPVAGVAGNVKRPAIYEIEPQTTLRRLLELAGGVTPLGYLQRVQVERLVANEKKMVVDVDLLTPQRQGARDDVWQTRIHDGDLVRVFAIITTPANLVQLEGHAVRPGTYELKPGMRLRDLLGSYDALLPEPYLAYGEIVRYIGPDLRRTAVPFHLGALLAGDPSHNLALQPRDIVRVFPQADFVEPPQVRISGLVHKPGIYPLTEHMRVSDLVFRAGNVLKFAYLERAELTRRVAAQAGEAVMRIEIDLGRALQGDVEHNLFLQDFDHLMVRQLPGVELERDLVVTDGNRPSAKVYPLVESDGRAVAALQRAGRFVERSVEVSGEVRFPGTYPLLKGERVSSVLRRAGGFTPNAYLRGAVFTRARVRQEQQQRLQELIREQELALLAQGTTSAQAALSTEELQAQRQALEQQRVLLERLKAIQPEGRLVVRLEALETFTGSVQDIELEAGDRLVIPETPKYVNVLGEVYNHAALIYEPHRTIGEYLEKVGGVRADADTDQIYLVQVDGTVISSTQNQYAVVLASGQTMRFKDFFKVQPQPGDTIVVPRRITTTATLRNVRDIVQIIFQSASTLGVVAALLTAL